MDHIIYLYDCRRERHLGVLGNWYCLLLVSMRVKRLRYLGLSAHSVREVYDLGIALRIVELRPAGALQIRGLVD